MMEHKKFTKEELAAAVAKTVPDIIAPHLDILFCGINPGLYTAASGWHFGRPGNRFWKALYASGLTPRLFHPSEQYSLLSLGLGITNFVPRATATAAELSGDEIREGARALEEKVKKYRPKALAILGLSTYRVGFNQPKAVIGLQNKVIGATKVWVLPNPSGLQAYYSGEKIAALLAKIEESVHNT